MHPFRVGKAVLCSIAGILILGLVGVGCIPRQLRRPAEEAAQEEEATESPSPSPEKTRKSEEGDTWKPFDFRSGQYFKYSVT